LYRYGVPVHLLRSMLGTDMTGERRAVHRPVHRRNSDTCCGDDRVGLSMHCSTELCETRDSRRSQPRPIFLLDTASRGRVETSPVRTDPLRYFTNDVLLRLVA